MLSFEYLKKTQDYGLFYSSYPSVLEGYSDASLIIDEKDSAFMSGWVYLLYGGAVSWASTKQTCIIDFIVPAKFAGFATVRGEWFRVLALKTGNQSRNRSNRFLHFKNWI